MPVKITSNPKQKGIKGRRIPKEIIKKMVKKYRSPLNKLHFSHFSIEEVMTLLVDNKVFLDGVKVADQKELLQTHGLKLYMGKHYGKETCPGRDDRSKPDNYLNRHTIILCTTEIEKNAKYKYKDMLKEDVHSISFPLSNFYKDGEGLDMGTICPPDCPEGDDPDYDIYYAE